MIELCGDVLMCKLYRSGPGALELTGADHDTFRLVLVALTKVRGDNPSGAKKQFLEGEREFMLTNTTTAKK